MDHGPDAVATYVVGDSEARSTAAEAAAHEVLPVLMTTEKDFYKSFDDSLSY